MDGKTWNKKRDFLASQHPISAKEMKVQKREHILLFPSFFLMISFLVCSSVRPILNQDDWRNFSPHFQNLLLVRTPPCDVQEQTSAHSFLLFFHFSTLLLRLLLSQLIFRKKVFVATLSSLLPLLPDDLASFWPLENSPFPPPRPPPLLPLCCVCQRTQQLDWNFGYFLAPPSSHAVFGFGNFQHIM